MQINLLLRLIMNAIEKNQHTCLPPEAYIRLWQKAENSTEMPKFRSTVYPNKNIKAIPFKEK
jgi:hypothetical protein